MNDVAYDLCVLMTLSDVQEILTFLNLLLIKLNYSLYIAQFSTVH